MSGKRLGDTIHTSGRAEVRWADANTLVVADGKGVGMFDRNGASKVSEDLGAHKHIQYLCEACRQPPELGFRARPVYGCLASQMRRVYSFALAVLKPYAMKVVGMSHIRIMVMVPLAVCDGEVVRRASLIAAMPPSATACNFRKMHLFLILCNNRKLPRGHESRKSKIWKRLAHRNLGDPTHTTSQKLRSCALVWHVLNSR